VSRNRCCCYNSCSNESCAVTKNHCATQGIMPFTIDVSVSATVTTCIEWVCEITEGEFGTFVGLNGCQPCYPLYPYPDCVPCRTTVEAFTGLYEYSTFYRNYRTDFIGGTYPLSWNDGWHYDVRLCVTSPSEIQCWDNATFIPAECEFLPYKTVFGSGSFTRASFEGCNGGPPLLTNPAGLYGDACNGICQQPGGSCCCQSCLNVCQSMRSGWKFLTPEVLKDGVIRARVAQVVPCTGHSLEPAGGEWWCGEGCTDQLEDDGYSRITIVIEAWIPTVAADCNSLYTTLGFPTPSPTPGQIYLPNNQDFCQAGLADEDGEFWALATNSIAATFRRCRSSTSASNRCYLEKGAYELVRLSLGNCFPEQEPGCPYTEAVSCARKELRELLFQYGWTIQVEVR
jgi:hypothetical protein